MPSFTGERSNMIFSSLPFLFFYLVAVLAVYKLSPLKLRNLILLVVSLFFYGWGEPVYIIKIGRASCRERVYLDV